MTCTSEVVTCEFCGTEWDMNDQQVRPTGHGWWACTYESECNHRQDMGTGA